jgi:hypothetical protein
MYYSCTETEIRGYSLSADDTVPYFNQLWLVQAIPGETNVYGLRNLRGGTYIDKAYDNTSSMLWFLV